MAWASSRTTCYLSRLQGHLSPSKSPILSWLQNHLLGASFSQILVLPFAASGSPNQLGLVTNTGHTMITAPLSFLRPLTASVSFLFFF